ncbi:GAP family protein [Mycolicibacterium sp. CBM1]
MWSAVLIMAVAVIFEPVRIGLAVLLLNRPRPLLHIVAFLAGGFAMGVGVGLVVLFLLRRTTLASGGIGPARMQIVVGSAVVLVAALMFVGAAIKPAQTIPHGKLSARAKNLLQRDSLWVAGASGLGTALPSANYLGAMAVILSSGVEPLTQIEALVSFNLVAFALVEVALVTYLAAPDRTRMVMSTLHEWLQARPRRDIAVIVAAGGCLMVAIGVFRL